MLVERINLVIVTQHACFFSFHAKLTDGVEKYSEMRRMWWWWYDDIPVLVYNVRLGDEPQ